MRAKFVCNSVTKTALSEIPNLSPVVSGSEENKSFSEFTPSGKLELNITNTALFGFYKPGKEYYLDVTEA